MERTILFLICIVFVFIGCTTSQNEREKSECKKAGKDYIIVEKFNFRTGEMNNYVKCK